MGIKLIEIDLDHPFSICTYRGRDAARYLSPGTTEEEALAKVRVIIEEKHPQRYVFLVSDPDGTRSEEV